MKREIDLNRFTPKHIKEAEQWAKEACNRIFSHYSKEELELERKKNS